MSTTPAPPALRVKIRWCIRRDLADMLYVDAASFRHHWEEPEFCRLLAKKAHFGMIAERDDRVVGFMVYILRRTSIELLKFAVDPEYRELGVGRQMAGRLVGKLSPDRRVRISLLERERNDIGIEFWAAQGFRAVGVEREAWRDTLEDGYRFAYELPSDDREDVDKASVRRFLMEGRDHV